MRILSRSFLFPFSLTVAALVAAMHLGIPKVAVAPAAGTSHCPHTGCFGTQACLYSPNATCAIHAKAGSCTTYFCE